MDKEALVIIQVGATKVKTETKIKEGMAEDTEEIAAEEEVEEEEEVALLVTEISGKCRRIMDKVAKDKAEVHVGLQPRHKDALNKDAHLIIQTKLLGCSHKKTFSNNNFSNLNNNSNTKLLILNL